MKEHYSKKLATLSITSFIAIILVISAAFVLTFSNILREIETKHAEQIRLEYTNARKAYIRNAIERVIARIDTERSLCRKLRTSVEHQPDGSGHAHQPIEDICSEEAIRQRMANAIRQTRLKDDGYIWINQILNYDGGEQYAIRLVHPNLPATENSYLSTDTTDIKGNRPYLAELEGIKKHGELFFDYWFKKMGSSEIAHKLTFAKLYKHMTG